MGRASCDDHPGKRQQYRRFPDSTQQHRWSAGSETISALKQPIPNSPAWAAFFFLCCPICRLICRNKSSVSFRSCRFCLWPRWGNSSTVLFLFWRSSQKKKINKNNKQIQASLLSLDWFFYWQSVFGMRQIHTSHKEVDIDTQNINYKPSGRYSLSLRLTGHRCLLWSQNTSSELVSAL